MGYIINQEKLTAFEQQLISAEKSKATIEKYLRDMRTFLSFAGENREITKELVISYKQYLSEHYQLTSANSMLAALNHFFTLFNWQECKVKPFKIQRQLCRSEARDLSREDYVQLLETAKHRNQIWLYLIMLTICATGIRVSELPFITVESLCTRRATVSLKGKTRTVILPVKLCQELRRYAKQRGIQSGRIFITRSGKPIDRSNIFHAMKKLCTKARVECSKVFPHNLRHLFAVTYYKKKRDISHLADILGHSNINTTRIYTLVSIEEQERQIRDLGLVV